MNTQQPRRLPDIKFRVLIIGRANAGKTSILQRVCETTESPFIYRGGKRVTLNPSVDRGEHMIDDELIFSNHTGYIFHDSRGVESGGTEELAILKNFIRQKCGERRLKDKLHAIWYCIPMDNHRPELDLRFFSSICPDQNVPVIAVFTKYDQFRRNVKIDRDDYGNPDDNVSEVAEKRFREHYLRPLGDHVGFVRLEQMHRKNRRCDDLIEKTAAALNGDTVALMLLTVQKSNLKLSVKMALKRVHFSASFEVEGAVSIVRKCLFAFPFLWWYEEFSSEEDEFFFEELSSKEEESEEEVSGCGASVRFRHADDACPRLSRNSLKKNLNRNRRNRSSSKNSSNSNSNSDSIQNDRIFIAHFMSLPTIQNLTTTDLSGHHLILAVILILKHATLLRSSNLSPKLALTHAELNYRAANIDVNIQQYLMASSQEHSVDLFAAFIMATDILPSPSSVIDILPSDSSTTVPSNSLVKHRGNTTRKDK